MAGLGDKVAGKAKEVEGTVTGDKAREAEGQAQGARGDLKDKAQDVGDQVKGAANEAAGKTDK